MADMPQKDSKSSRVDIIKAVQTPLGFFTLVVLIAEVFLGIFASKTKDDTSLFVFLVVSMVVLLFALVGIVAYIGYSKPAALMGLSNVPLATGEKGAREIKYDVFLSSPMAALHNDKLYQIAREETMKVADCLRKTCGFQTIFYAGQHIENRSSFDPADLSVIDDIDAIRKSKYFVLIYPQKMSSSIIFEAGCAAALNIYSIYFVRNRRHLPFLMRQAEQAFTNVKIYQYSKVEDIINILSKKKIFREC